MKHARIPFIAALALSGALHAAGAIAIAPHQDALAIEGGATATVALLGEAFEDLAQGAQPVEASEAVPALPLSARPVTAAAALVVPAMATPPAPALSLPVSDSADLTAAPPADPAPPVTPEPAPPVLASLAPTPAPPTFAPPPLSPVQPATAVEPDPAAPETSPRPRPRAEKPEKRAVEKRVATPAGNADRNASKGAQAGKDTARAAAAGTARVQGNQQAGNAARSNYPGLVLRQIERTRKPAHAARGTVVVAFRVAASGALASARVARSTGDPSLERVALDHIRRAAPFPPPPAGAETDFRFEFIGRR